ncbi:Bug family tripartite tricarboxylate transporter substrate binding protein [Shouchella sp. JSM 1781072]|uniref:Bug family tripartite tricarboxylate transporter substrate binding protein n=1 Tax=Bacillaceae TaxID=186817 RepID=UPI0020D0097A|nr:tripartite tricarboxylate transporter substrate-binding protein [Alkalihalobacillus sp. LMS6]UTR07277.1 tripartite tricarboxylate transporter substrate binding protein [Alkalihalobacillus sp. LMS6]
MKLMFVVCLLILLVGCGSGNSSTNPSDEAWSPTRDIEFVAPARAGGGWDTSARMITNVIMEQGLMEQNIGVVNKPGGTGAVGWAYIENQKSDHTFFTTSSHMIYSMLSGNSDYNWDDLTPIANLAADYGIIAVSGNAPWNSLSELMEDYKMRPSELTVIGTNTPGGQQHIQFVDLATEAGVSMEDIRYVADPGTGGIPSLLSGHVQILSSTLGAGSIEQHRAGDIKILAVFAEERVQGEDISSIPTAIEQGYDTVHVIWRGVFGPSILSEEQVSYYESVLREVNNSQQFAEIRERLGWTEMFMDSEEYAEFIEKEVESNRVIMKELGLLAEGR